MSNTDNGLNAIKLLQHGLEKQVRSVLLEEVVDKLTTDYEKVVRESIIPIIDRITIGRVEGYRNVEFFRNELRIFVEMKEDEAKETEADGSGE